MRDAAPGTTLVRMAGRWSEETGGAGLFGVVRSEEPRDVGDPVTYHKETNFDSHYHDCDEYWIILEGRGTAASEGQLYEVGPGDCVATGMGHHHDFPLVREPVRAVFFETTLEGQKRRGHLWDHTHGPAGGAGVPYRPQTPGQRTGTEHIVAWPQTSNAKVTTHNEPGPYAPSHS